VFFSCYILCVLSSVLVPYGLARFLSITVSNRKSELVLSGIGSVLVPYWFVLVCVGLCWVRFAALLKDLSFVLVVLCWFRFPL